MRSVTRGLQSNVNPRMPRTIQNIIYFEVLTFVSARDACFYRELPKAAHSKTPMDGRRPRPRQVSRVLYIHTHRTTQRFLKSALELYSSRCPHLHSCSGACVVFGSLTKYTLFQLHTGEKRVNLFIPRIAYWPNGNGYEGPMPWILR